MRNLPLLLVMGLASQVFASPQESCLDRLNAKDIPADRRFPNQPAELVAVLGEKLASPTDTHHNIKVALSSGGRLLALSNSGKIFDLSDPKSPKVHATFENGGTAMCHGLAFSPDGKTLAHALSYPSPKREVYLWDTTVTPLKLKAKLPGTLESITLTFVDNRTLAVGAGDHKSGTVALWSVDVNPPVRRDVITAYKGYVSTILVSPDGKTLVANAWNNPVKLWDLTQSPPKEKASVGGVCMGLSPNGKLLASSGEYGPNIYISDLSDSSRKPAILSGPPHASKGLVFTNDKTLFSLSAGGTVVKWDVATGAKRSEWQLPGRFGLAYPYIPPGTPGGAGAGEMVLAPDGRHLLAVDETGLVYVLRIATTP